MKIRNMTRAALFAALICVCAWITLPVPPLRFTLQNFGVALALLTLGGRWGSRAVMLYLALGAVGMPVFSGFRGGPGALLDVTGGFLWGFLAWAWVYRLAEPWGKGPAMALGYAACTAWGGGWFALYTGSPAAALAGVAAYLLPDLIKLTLAAKAAARLRRYLQP